MLNEFGRISPKELADKFLKSFQIHVDVVMIRHALHDVKKQLRGRSRFRSHRRISCNSFKDKRRDADRSLHERRSLQRGIFFPKNGIEAFSYSSKVVGLDACHIKAKYGGVILVMTFLDGKGSVFPGAIGVA